MRVVFLTTPFKFKISRASRWPEQTKSGTLYYPFWTAQAAGYCESQGNEILLLDAIANGWGFETTIEKIDEFKPDLVVVDTSLPSIKSDAKFVDQLKEKCDTKVCMVGSYPSIYPEKVFEMSSSLDFIAFKEYDETIVELCNNNLKPEGVLGIIYSKDGKVVKNKDRPFLKDLDKIPFVSKIYKRFLNPADYRYALARHPMIQIMSARGCPNMCVYCNVPQTFMSRDFRMRSPKHFVDEMEWINKNMPEIKEIFIEDDTMTVDKERMKEICKLIMDRGLKIVWSCNVRADIPYDVLVMMKKAGCRMMIVGYESGNQNILNNIKKGITLEMAEEFTKNAKKAGIKIFGCFMIGLPGDTRETIQETFEWAKKVNPDMAQIEQIVPFPGTEFYDWAKDKGYLLTDEPEEWLNETGQLNFIIDYPNLRRDEIAELRDKLMVRFYLNPKQFLTMLKDNLHPSEMKRLSKASYDYLIYLLERKLSKKKSKKGSIKPGEVSQKSNERK